MLEVLLLAMAAENAEIAHGDANASSAPTTELLEFLGEWPEAEAAELLDGDNAVEPKPAANPRPRDKTKAVEQDHAHP